MSPSPKQVVWLDAVGRGDVKQVGGKNASLGEMLRQLGASGVRVPPGFATTAAAYWDFVSHNGLEPVIREHVGRLQAGTESLETAGAAIRAAFAEGQFPPKTTIAILQAYRDLCARFGTDTVDVAVRSSATAEDLPDASFAGQHESMLNVHGERALLEACRRCLVSLFKDRAIAYRQTKGFDHLKIALSIGVQKMVRSDLSGSGVMFSIDTETGFDRVVLINAAWGLGENVVQGTVDPDEYVAFKPLLQDTRLTPIVEKTRGEKARKLVYSADADHTTRNVETTEAERAAFVLSDPEILQLARWAYAIEAHYGCPMDMEWAKDGESGDLWVVQARPETIQSRKAVGSFKTYRVHPAGPLLVSGLAIGDSAVAGPVHRLDTPADPSGFPMGAVLVTANTDPDWVPIMKRAAAIVTDHGGRTSHAAIVSRELGLPAVVGTGKGTALLREDQPVTVSCADGDIGFVYDGTGAVDVEELSAAELPATQTAIMLNLGDPAAAFHWWRLPADGSGLVRMEFVISNHIRIHPMALVRPEAVEDPEARRAIAELTRGHADPKDYFVERLARGLARIAACFHPKPVIVRMSDYKTNEYANLIGGRFFEPHEENPMLGFRGASRYYSERYRAGFALECAAIRKLRDEIGLRNVVVMIPFCRSPAEADRVLGVMADNGLRRGENGLQVYVMCEIPSNVVLARDFARRFDGFSIGSNDLTQLTLGVDRDSSELSGLFDEEDEAVKWMIRHVIREAHAGGAKVGLCGQAPSDRPDFADFLVACGIDSISVSPDSFAAVKRRVAAAEHAGAGAIGKAARQ